MSPLLLLLEVRRNLLRKGGPVGQGPMLGRKLGSHLRLVHHGVRLHVLCDEMLLGKSLGKIIRRGHFALGGDSGLRSGNGVRIMGGE